MCITTICTTSVLKPISLPLFIPLLPIYPVSTLETLIVYFLSIIFIVSTSFLNVSFATPSARAMERLNGDSFQPFRGLSKLWLGHASAFSFLLLFSDTIFFQLGTSVRVWQVCHCGPLSLFVYL